MLIIEDLREYVFAIFFGEETEKDMVSRDSLKFLGTAFFCVKETRNVWYKVYWFHDR